MHVFVVNRYSQKYTRTFLFLLDNLWDLDFQIFKIRVFELAQILASTKFRDANENSRLVHYFSRLVVFDRPFYSPQDVCLERVF